MLELARAKFRPDEDVDFRPADAAALTFPDDGFDAVVCQFGVMFFPDKDRSYREIHRVLAPGGRYLFSVWDAHRYNHFGSIVHKSSAASFLLIRLSSTRCLSPITRSTRSRNP
jgi:ubiquinone/menaquinone biosynthesis C-methylase UbiE